MVPLGNLKLLFGRDAPHHLEIGFGMGEALTATARAHPENDYLGIEVYRPGVGNLLARLAAEGLSNVRVFCADATEVLQGTIPDSSLEAIYVFFPDPWPKTRHHKRRLIQPPFVDLVRQKLRPAGRIYLATDWEDYARQMMGVMSEAKGLKNVMGEGQYAPRPLERLLTKFEKRGQALGHRVWDLVFERTN
jgi:tRNA (guanine-N7-)-methyltransferase